MPFHSIPDAELFDPWAKLPWEPILPTYFVNPALAPTFDVNGILTSLTHLGSGTYRAVWTRSAVSTDGMGEGAAFRLNNPTGWVGDGCQTIWWRITPLTDSNAALVQEIIGLGWSKDLNGDLTTAGLSAGSAAIIGSSLVVGSWRGTTQTRATAALSIAPDCTVANDTSVISRLIQTMRIGTSTTIGAGGGGSVCEQTGSIYERNTGTWSSGALDAGTVSVDTDEFWTWLCLGFRTTGGAVVCTADFRIEQLVQQQMPAGSVGP